MKTLLDLAWILVKILSLGALAGMLAGVALFGWHFVRTNAAAARTEGSEVPPSSWRGPAARKAYIVFAAGVAMLVASEMLSAALPGRL